MRKLKKNYKRKNDSIVAMDHCWCPCDAAFCICSDAHTQNYANYKQLATNSRASTHNASYLP